MTADDVFDDYYRGAYTAPESVARLMRVIDAGNVDAVMSQVPESFLPFFERWAESATDPEALYFAPGWSTEAIQEAKAASAKAVPIVRDWLEKHQRRTRDQRSRP